MPSKAGGVPAGCRGKWKLDMARIESPLIGSGSQEEVDLRVQALLDLGTSRGYLTYEELNERLPDEVVSPDKLDSLLMMIDEMGIKLIDESDIADFNKPNRAKPDKPEKTERGIRGDKHIKNDGKHAKGKEIFDRLSNT